MSNTYTTSAPFYDHIYRLKDYAREVAALRRLITEHTPEAKTLLDVACGSGGHLVFLTRYYDCVGIDLSADLLAIARAKLPSIPFYEGDMRDFDLKGKFDVVTCLFSAIGYVKTLESMLQAVANMARHVAPGGLLIVEPWFTPETYHPGYTHADLIESEQFKLCRMSISQLESNLSVLDVHHLVTVNQTITHFIERHEMGLFTHEQYLNAVESAGLQPVYEEKGLIGRGLYLGINPV